MIYDQYPSFEDWFYEIESFSTRAERFYSILDIVKNGNGNDETVVNWLRAAFDSAKKKEIQ